MPFRLNEERTKIQFVTFAKMPSLIYKACQKTDTVSNTRYIQEAVCARLAVDLDLDLDELLADLPEPKGNAKILWNEARKPEKQGAEYHVETFEGWG